MDGLLQGKRWLCRVKGISLLRGCAVLCGCAVCLTKYNDTLTRAYSDQLSIYLNLLQMLLLTFVESLVQHLRQGARGGLVCRVAGSHSEQPNSANFASRPTLLLHRRIMLCWWRWCAKQNQRSASGGDDPAKRLPHGLSTHYAIPLFFQSAS